VTDANFVLGRLSPGGLIGGRMRLDEAAARAALAPAAERLGFGVEKTALGILGIVVATMVRAIRAVSVERGLDPRDYSLMAFGGAGALHAGDVARALGIGEILVPPAPGILCAQGLIVSEMKEDFVSTDRILLGDGGTHAVQAYLEGLLDKAGAWFEAEGVDPARQTLQVSLDMRFVGQNFELSVPVDQPINQPAGGARPRLPGVRKLHDLFFQVHEQHYGFHNPADPVEVISVRVTATAALAHATPGGAARQAPPPTASSERPVHFDGDGPRPTPVYDRAALAPGHTLAGPAIIEQFDATTVLHLKDRLSVDDALNMVIEVTP
jgi:N-methylhydantoinase A